MPNTLPDAQKLNRLCALLQTPSPHQLTFEHFQQWKPLAESLARSQSADAMEVGQLLIDLATAATDPVCLPFALWSAANLYYRLGDFAQADSCFQRAADLYETRNEPINIARMSVAWVHALGELQRYQEAFACAARAERLLVQSQEAIDQERLMGLYNTTGIIYEETGRLTDALHNYEKSHAYYTALTERTHSQLLNFVCVLQSMGIVQTLLGQYAEADRAFTHALTLMEPVATLDDIRAEQTRTLMNRAWLLTIQQAAPLRIRAAFQTARRSRSLLDEGSALRNFALLDLDEANWLLHNGKADGVDQAQLQHLATAATAAGMHFEAIYAAILLGQLALYQGAVAWAEQHFAAILATLDDTNPALVYLAHRWHARALQALGRYDAAKAALAIGIHQVESTRHRLTTEDYRAGYLDDKLVAYQDLVALHLRSGEDEQAFQIGEGAKARTLTETMGNAPTQSTYVGQRDALSAVPTIEQLAKTLTPQQLAISYTTVADGVYAFLVNHHGLALAPIRLAPAPTRARLESDLAKIQQIGLIAPSDNGAIGQELLLTQQILTTWFDWYLAPLAHWLDQYEQLIIAPDGLLHRLPFAACFCAERGQYLIETHSITVVPSLTTWSLLTPKTRRYANVLVVGSSRMGGQVGALPQAVHEAQMVAATFAGATLLLEDAATLEAVITHCPQADLIYIAAHGEYAPGDPAASFLELADQPLRVADLLALKLTATIVVLNGCETNKGLLRGNEMMGLVRALLYAGAQAVIATHWSIDDVASMELMEPFVTAIHNGESPSTALQIAQCTMIHGAQTRYRHPFFWGGQQLIGRSYTSL